MAPAAPGSTWKPHDSLTTPPTNLKEAIDWVLRVTGRDGKKNTAATQSPSTDNPPHCLCYLAKAVKDLLYDAKDPGSPGPSPDRNWDDLLLEQEKDIAQPVLTDLGLDKGEKSNPDGCGGTEVIRALIDHLALGLQKWVGWRDGMGNQANGTIRYCDGSGIGKKWSSGNTEQEYRSSYDDGVGKPCTWPTLSDKADQVHLLARIFLGSVCLIWSGLSQLGFLTGGSGRWSDSSLYDISDTNAGLGSFMAAMGYDLERLNGSGYFVWNLLAGKNDKPGAFNEFTKDSATQKSVAEYYSTIYGSANKAEKNTERLCEKYPLLVLHILASGYFRAGSAGAKNITSAPKAAPGDPRKPRTIREILYWLSALPYSEKYRALVERMQGKYPRKEGDPQKAADEIKLYDDKDASNVSTTLKRNDITHYLMAACGYCPLVLIGIQGTIATSGKESGTTTSGNSNGNNQGGSPNQNNGQSNKNRCPKHKDNPHKRCTLEDANKAAEAVAQPSAATQPQSQSQSTTGQPLKAGQVCYGGYHLEVSKFGPLHGMYANGLFGFHMDLSAAQCLDQLRTYVYHCFYQLYFLRKQCSAEAVLGWQSCRYGYQVGKKSGKVTETWQCTPLGTGGVADHTKKCGIFDGTSNRTESPLQSFLCDRLGSLRCQSIIGTSSTDKYPSIEDHMNTNTPIHPNGHLKQQCGHCPIPMGWQSESSSSITGDNHFKDLTTGSHKTDALIDGKGSGVNPGKYAAHCTGNTLSHLLAYYCDPVQCPSGTLVVLLRLLACITPTVPRTLGDLFGFYYYIVYIGGKQGGGGGEGVNTKLTKELKDVRLGMNTRSDLYSVVGSLSQWSGACQTGTQNGSLKCLVDCTTGTGAKYLSPLSGQQYGQLSPAMAGTYLSWLVYLVEDFKNGLEKLKGEFRNINCKDPQCITGQQTNGCGGEKCGKGSHGDTCNNGTGGIGNQGVCKCASVVSCTGVLPVLYKYGFGYGDVTELHKGPGLGNKDENKKCHDFLGTLEKIESSGEFTKLTTSINQLIYTTRLPWIFVLTLAWLVAVLYLAFGAIWPLDWTHMRSHCRGWFRKGSLSPWEVLMVGKKKGRGILEFFGKT